MDRTAQALEVMRREEPELAARLFVQMLPAAAQRLEGPLTYDLAIDGLGTWRVDVAGNGGGARVERVLEGALGEVDFTIASDAAGIAALAARESPLRLMLRGRVRIRGKRRLARKLRALGDGPDPTIAEALAAGAELDADAIYRSLPYLIDPEWTRGHAFTVAYEIPNVGEWYVRVSDGKGVRVSSQAPSEGQPDARIRLSLGTYTGLVSGTMTPPEAMQRHLIEIHGEIYPTTLLGRWIDRSQGRDDAELEREERQRAVQERRLGSWGGHRGNGRPLPAQRPVASPAHGGDPGDDSARGGRRGGGLVSYGALEVLGERQNWGGPQRRF